MNRPFKQPPGKRKLYALAFGLGSFLFLSCLIPDIFFYPELRSVFLPFRILICLILIFAVLLSLKVRERYLDLLATVFTVVSGGFVTLFCLLSGEGFASPYYAGLFIIIMVCSLFFYMKSTYYFSAVFLTISFHFFLLSFQTVEIKYLVLQIFVLVPSILAGSLTHHLVYSFFVETRMLEGILPICANCKKIRDDEGEWNQIESYINTQHGTDFTHDICPACAKELYEFDTEDLSS